MCRPIQSPDKNIQDGEGCVHSLLSFAPTVPYYSCCFLISLLAVQLELNAISEYNYVLVLYKQNQKRDVVHRAVDPHGGEMSALKRRRFWMISSVLQRHQTMNYSISLCRLFLVNNVNFCDTQNTFKKQQCISADRFFSIFFFFFVFFSLK